MANNRTEAKSAVITALVPTLTLTQHKALLNDEINESTVFRKDVIASETPVAGSVTINYSNKDTATVTTVVNLAVSFTNIENGDVKYLSITKGATNTISFAGATDVSQRRGFINSSVTLVVYVVRNKNGNIYIDSINIDNAVKETKIIDIGDWDMFNNQTVNINHGITNYKSIRITSVTVRDDSDGTYYAAGSSNQLSANWITSTQIQLDRGTGFGSSIFSTTSYNRGWIIVEYEP